MRKDDIRTGFDEAINKAKQAGVDAGTIARMEVCREYFTEADFKKRLEDFTWQVNQKP